MADARQYAVIVQLGRNTSPQRLAEMIPRLRDQLSALSEGPPEQLLRSVTADLFGWLIRSKMTAPQIHAAIESPGRYTGPKVDPFLDGSDGLIVLQVGPDFLAGKGFTRVGTWLQRH